MEERRELQLAGVRLLREWSTWMVGVETALLGFLVSLLSRDMVALGSPYLKGAAICFGVSMAFAACVLGALPSVAEQLGKAERGIYAIALFDIPVVRVIRLGWLAFVQHSFFLLGLCGLIASILQRQLG